jgi:hypothetical protein
MGVEYTAAKCSECWGRGLAIDGDTCRSCNGTGKIPVMVRPSRVRLSWPLRLCLLIGLLGIIDALIHLFARKP